MQQKHAQAFDAVHTMNPKRRNGGAILHSAKLLVEGTVCVHNRQLFFSPSAFSSPNLKGRYPIDDFCSLGALAGDRVMAYVGNFPGVRRKHHIKRHEYRGTASARVAEVLDRCRTDWIGLYQVRQGETPIICGDGVNAPAMMLPTEFLCAFPEHGVLVRVEPLQPYTGKETPVRVRVVEIIGREQDSQTVERFVISRFALRVEFTPEVLQESEALSHELSATEYATREDWREECVVTIDPPDARDFDDAICLRRLPERQGWELAVHIADVSFYVRPGSALDAEAQRRGNSTYLPARVLPMLPERLCDDLCSLVPGKDRPTVLCLIRLDTQGRVRGCRVARAVIRSCKRIAYPQFQELINEGTSLGDARVDGMLRNAAKLAALMRMRRMEAGALDLDVPELRVLVSDVGETIGVETLQSDESHRVIEEFMVAANEQVARMLRAASIPSIFRIHTEPQTDQWVEFVRLLRSYDISVSPIPSREETNKALHAITDHPDETLLKIAFLRTMARACYDTHPVGHFGLATPDYCHFTSPIRRYADLVVHRSLLALCGIEKKEIVFPMEACRRLAEHISRTERISAAAEAEATRRRLFAYIQQLSFTEPPPVFSAVVVGVWGHGVAVDLEDFHLRGYIPAEFVRSKSRNGRRLRGKNGMPQVGSRLSVAFHSVDWERSVVELRPV